MNSSFLTLYNEVIDEHGNVKLCGRDKCKDLIICCMSMNPDNAGSYGDVSTGIMNVANIVSFKKELFG